MNAMREVLALELTQRARSTRWRALLVGWFVVLSGTVLLQTLFFRNVGPGLSGDEDAWAAASCSSGCWWRPPKPRRPSTATGATGCWP